MRFQNRNTLQNHFQNFHMFNFDRWLLDQHPLLLVTFGRMTNNPPRSNTLQGRWTSKNMPNKCECTTKTPGKSRSRSCTHIVQKGINHRLRKRNRNVSICTRPRNKSNNCICSCMHSGSRLCSQNIVQNISNICIRLIGNLNTHLERCQRNLDNSLPLRNTRCSLRIQPGLP